MVRAVALVAQDRMTRPLLTFPRSPPERRRRDEEERRQRVMVITEFDAGDPEATMHAMATEILEYAGPCGCWRRQSDGRMLARRSR